MGYIFRGRGTVIQRYFIAWSGFWQNKSKFYCGLKQLYHLTTVAEEKRLKLIFPNFITVAAYKQYGIKNKLKFRNTYADLDIGLA